jgi:pilus assembly protein Flp/PilA
VQTLQNKTQRRWWGAIGRTHWKLGLFVRTATVREALIEECGQDLIEYALVVALIALAATASMSGVAAAISTAFTNVGIKVGTYTS